MNKGFIFGTVVGVVAGAAAGYFYAKKKFQDEKEAELENIREYYKLKYEGEKSFKECMNEPEENEKTEKEEDPRDMYAPTPSEQKPKSSIAKKPASKKEPVDYSKMSEKEEKAKPKPKKTTKKKEAPKVYAISMDEFVEPNGFDKVTFTYYEDGVFTDDMDEIVIGAIDEVGGQEMIDIFGDNPDAGENTLYVRNELMSCDYEIVFANGTYAKFAEENGLI